MDSLTEESQNSQESTATTDTSNVQSEDVFNILVATDIHLGYGEKDPIREHDTFDTFEEVLQIAVREQVDFVLLGGDLFHETRPSPYCIYKCNELLRKYCLGDRPVAIEFLSDPSLNFQYTCNDTVNYEDSNINVSVPVFSIHGNHDDPTGTRQISAMDVIASTGLINYFGKWHSHSEVKIKPILLKKGASQLALYGLSHIKDERLGRLFLDNKVTMMSPQDQDEWFHLLVWHQNRASRGVKNFIPDDSLPDFLDLVVWGHEHDCRIREEEKPNGVYISQPGSTVATSLSEGESIPKCVGLLKIHQKKFILKPIELKTVRPFIMDDITLDQVDAGDKNDDISDKAAAKVTEKIDDMMRQAQALDRTKSLPLIRLIVKYFDERQIFNAIRFGQSYKNTVANPDDMLKIVAYKKETTRRPRLQNFDDLPDNTNEADPITRVEDIVLRTLREENTLVCLSAKGMTEAVTKFIDSGDTDAPSRYIQSLNKRLMDKLEEGIPDIENVDHFIQNLMLEEGEEILQRPTITTKNVASTSHISVDLESDDETVTASTSKPAKGRGSRGGRVAKAPRAARGRRGSKAS